MIQNHVLATESKLFGVAKTENRTENSSDNVSITNKVNQEVDIKRKVYIYRSQRTGRKIM